MRVGLDIDDVLVPFVDAVHTVAEAANLTGGATPTSWDLHVDYGCTREALWGAVEDAYRGGLLRDLNPYPGVPEALAAIRGAGHTVHLVTARSQSPLHDGSIPAMQLLIREHTVAWLAAHELAHDSLTFSRDKTVVRTAVFLDDSARNVLRLKQAGVPAWLCTRGHNVADPTAVEHDLPRVAGLVEFTRDVLEVKVVAS